MKRVRKAVLPVAGLGTRMLPAAKTVAKEMLTVVDRPLIHWVLAEARAAWQHGLAMPDRGKHDGVAKRRARAALEKL